MTEQVGYEKGGKAAYEKISTRYSSLTWDMLHGNRKKRWYEIARAACEAERPALIDEVLDAAKSIARGYMEPEFIDSFLMNVLARLAKPAQPQKPEPSNPVLCDSCGVPLGGIHFGYCTKSAKEAAQPAESTMPSYVEYKAMTPAERESCVQKAQVPQHDSTLAKMVIDLVLAVAPLISRVDALENGAK